jgi:hypothetical protein
MGLMGKEPIKPDVNVTVTCPFCEHKETVTVMLEAAGGPVDLPATRVTLVHSGHNPCAAFLKDEAPDVFLKRVRLAGGRVVN